MALAFLRGSTSGGPPMLLTAGLALAMVSTSIDYYGIDTFARPIGRKLPERRSPPRSHVVVTKCFHRDLAAIHG